MEVNGRWLPGEQPPKTRAWLSGRRGRTGDVTSLVLMDPSLLLALSLVFGIAVGAGPSCVAADLDRLYVADHSGVVTALSVAHETATDVLTLPEVRELEPA